MGKVYILGGVLLVLGCAALGGIILWKINSKVNRKKDQ